MRAEIELPPLPDGWANGPVEIGYGVPSTGSKALVLTCLGWDKWTGSDTPFVYAVCKWQPAIVTAGVLAPGWVVIDPDGTYWQSRHKPTWCDGAREWTEIDGGCLRLSEHPQITGRNAIWEIK